MAIVLVRYLGSTRLGLYYFAVTLVGLFGFFADLGLTALVTREVSKDKKLSSSYLGGFFSIQVLLGLVFYSLVLVSVILLHPSQLVKTMIYIIGAGMVVGTLSHPFLAILNSHEEMHYTSLANAINVAINAFLIFLVIYLKGGLVSLAWVYFANNLTLLALTASFCSKRCALPRFEFDISLWTRLLRMAIPFTFLMIFSVVYYRIDIVMLMQMKGAKIVGWYAAPYKLIDALMLISAGFAGALFPVFSREFEVSKEILIGRLERAFKFMIALSFPITVGTTLLAQNIILLLFGVEFEKSIIALQILIWAILFLYGTASIGNSLIAANRVGTFALINCGCAFLNIGLNFALIPGYSYVGASVATVCSEILMLSLVVYFIRRYIGRIELIHGAALVGVASLVMGGALFFLRTRGLAISIPAGAIIYLLTLYLLGFFGKEERAMLREIVTGQRETR